MTASCRTSAAEPGATSTDQLLLLRRETWDAAPRTLRQREMAWYQLFFQFEGIAEQWLSADDFANMRAWAQHPDMDQVAIDLARPGALTAALNWYRANDFTDDTGPITVPTAALAISERSPKSWESSLRYGVSPQPVQAPENSNSGC